MDHFRAIKVFCRIVETGSFSRAASDLAIPPATVSTMVKDLEARLGVRLLERTTRRVAVTDQGRAYYDRTSIILDDLAEADEEVRTEAGALAGQVRVAAPRHLASALLIPALPELAATHPALDIDFVLGDHPIDLIAENVDIALRIGPLADSGLTARVLGEFPRVTCASPSFLAAAGQIVTPEDLPPQRLAYRFPGRNHGYPWSFEKDGEPFQITPTGDLSFDDLDAYVDAAIVGLGVIQVLWFQAQRALESAALVPILREWVSEKVPVSAVTTQRRYRARRVRGALDWLDRVVGDAAKQATA